MAEPSSLTAPQLSFDASELCAEEQRQILEVQHSILRMVVQESDDQIIFTELCNLAESLLPNAVASIMMQNAETGAMDVLCAPSVPPEGIAQLNGLVPGVRETPSRSTSDSSRTRSLTLSAPLKINSADPSQLGWSVRALSV